MLGMLEEQQKDQSTWSRVFKELSFYPNIETLYIYPVQLHYQLDTVQFICFIYFPFLGIFFIKKVKIL